jgi:Xaa-Pro aminopeptidase
MSFTKDEYKQRLKKVQSMMQDKGIELLISHDTNNMNYLTGYDAWSFYYAQCAIVHVNADEPLCFVRAQDSGGAYIKTYLKDENIIKRNVKSKAIIIFSKSDNMHPWNKWKSSAKKIKTALGKKKYHEYIFKGMNGWNTLEIEAKIITFLTGVDPTNGPEEVFIRPVEQIMDTNGANVNQHNNIVFDLLFQLD